ncbi:MAG: hypothetical protein ACPHIV_07290 [Candidatus Puniceispirillaceae bacterium]
MTYDIFIIVLLAAMMHAAWNAIIKGAADRTVTFGLVATGHMLPALVIAPFVPLPPPETVPYIIISTIIHWGYYFFLNASYRFGDLSLVYPIARGATPLLVAGMALVWLGEALTPLGWSGLVCISVGVLILGRRCFDSDKPLLTVAMALATSGTIAAYSIVDGVGVRMAPEAISYIVWLFIAEGLVVLFIFARCHDRFRALTRKQFAIGLGGGMLSALAYALALYAKTKAPIGMVSALRETSVIFAAMIGLFWFGEGSVRARLGAAILVFAGIVLLALA